MIHLENDFADGFQQKGGSAAIGRKKLSLLRLQLFSCICHFLFRESVFLESKIIPTDFRIIRRDVPEKYKVFGPDKPDTESFLIETDE